MIYTRQNAGAAALGFAITQAGLPYLWGGEAPGVGFDCDGLLRWAYGKVGVILTGNTYVNYKTAPATGPFEPGDGVFFRGSDPGPNDEPGHVGLYVGVGVIFPGQHAWTAAPGRPIFFNAPYSHDPFGLRFDYFDPAAVVAHTRPALLLAPSTTGDDPVDDVFISKNPNGAGDFLCAWSTRQAVGIPSTAIRDMLIAKGAARNDLSIDAFAYFHRSNWKV